MSGLRLTHPIIITARLLPGVGVGGGFLSIDSSLSSVTPEGRVKVHYCIDLPGGEEFEGEDLSLGVGSFHEPLPKLIQSALESLLSFLGAAAESYDYPRRTGRPGDNGELFPPAVAEWAYQNSDEIGLLQCELEEGKNLIEEAA